ncbi:hypothetical protein IWQ49_004702 [Labrenzia sp. EL_126]|nr:hypothetical protein [Labrenzia sp. EL_126]
MTENKKGLRSTNTGKPMRSRGFLSHSGGGAQDSADDTGGHAGERTMSRGTRQVSATLDGRPKSLSSKTKIKPYHLEGK